MIDSDSVKTMWMIVVLIAVFALIAFVAWYIPKQHSSRRFVRVEPEPDETLETLKKIEQHLAKLSSCVQTSSRSHGDRYSISTKHWND